MLTTLSARSSKGKSFGLIAALLAAALLLCSLGCRAKPAPNTAVVRYRNQGVVMPMAFENVVRVREYYVHGELYQVLVDQKDALTPVVFTPFEIVDYTAGEGVEIESFQDKVYHTYDPFLQQTKSEIRKAFIAEKYQQYFGREPSEAEFNEELEKLIEKVQLSDLEARIRTAPEAVVYRINALRDKPLTEAEQKRVNRMLERGQTADEVTEAFTK